MQALLPTPLSRLTSFKLHCITLDPRMDRTLKPTFKPPDVNPTLMFICMPDTTSPVSMELSRVRSQYSVMDRYGYASAFGPNFYGEDLAHRALYYRSGWTPALQAARVFGDNFVNSPQGHGERLRAGQ